MPTRRCILLKRPGPRVTMWPSRMSMERSVMPTASSPFWRPPSSTDRKSSWKSKATTPRRSRTNSRPCSHPSSTPTERFGGHNQRMPPPCGTGIRCSLSLLAQELLHVRNLGGLAFHDCLTEFLHGCVPGVENRLSHLDCSLVVADHSRQIELVERRSRRILQRGHLVVTENSARAHAHVIGVVPHGRVRSGVGQPLVHHRNFRCLGVTDLPGQGEYVGVC